MSADMVFIDSNIWLYAIIESDDLRHQAAKSAIQQIQAPVISSQVVSEICVNLLKKAKQTETFIQELVSGFYSKYEVVSLDEEILLKASDLRAKHSLSYWDSLICSAALESNCSILLTEDMQHSLLIEDRLKIVNPFL